ncbi:MAG: GntR family transcriptional regulator [Nocardioides sp.]
MDRDVTLEPPDPGADLPPYEQLRVQVARRVAAGELAAGTRLPTVRSLAADLHLAVNTVARAYRELETDGVVVTEGRRGTFVARSQAAASGTALDAARAYVTAVRRAGLSLEEAADLVARTWTVPTD